MLEFAKPNQVNGAVLENELAAAGYPIEDGDVRVAGTTLRVLNVDEGDRDDVQAVVDAHDPPPPRAHPDDALAAAIRDATTVDELKAALLDGEARIVGRLNPR